MNITVIQADYHNDSHATALVSLLNAYAEDPMGGGKPLPNEVCHQLIPELAKRSFAISLLAFCDDKAVGFINAFEGFSTFACKPLINIHDIAVLPDYRGRGISYKMLTHLEHLARKRGCCKLTLEVLSGNQTAKAAYQSFGFSAYQLREDTGQAEFWQKQLV